MKPKNTERGAGRTAVDRMDADCTAGERAATERTAGDRTVEERTAANRTAAGRTAGERTAAERRKKRRKSAIQGAVLITVLHLVAAGILLWVRAGHDPASFLAKFTLVVAGLELIGVVPIWFSLKERFKEIEGGEEDAAAQY